MTRILLPVALLLCSFPAFASAQDLEQQIRSEVARFVERINSGDRAGLADMYLADSTVAIGITAGWQEVSDLLSLAFAARGLTWMTADSVTVATLGENAAIAYFRYIWDYRTEAAAAATGALTLAFVRTGNGWKLARDHASTPPAVAGELFYSGPPSSVRSTFQCTVTRVVDGDTIDCEEMGRVRLIGMDTPESDQRPYGSQATEVLADLIANSSEIQLELDVERRDQYDRVLAYVWADGQLLNWILVRSGYAVVLTYPPNVQYVDWFTAAQEAAQRESAGLWLVQGFACLPRDHRRGRCD